MQTFLPFASFSKSASVLDNRRLCKQIVETEQIARALTDSSYGWQSHPTVCMWRGHYALLVAYGCAMYREWQARWLSGARGGKQHHKSGEELALRFREILHTEDSPCWLGDERLHSSHRACLLAKNFEHYVQFGWSETPTPPVDGRWPYWWPKEDI